MGRHKKPDNVQFQNTDRIEIANGDKNLPSNPKDESQKQVTRRQKLVRLLAEGLSVPEAGIMAGFTPGYSNAGLYSKVRSPKMLNEIREFCIQNNMLSVPKVLKIYNRALNIVDKELDSGELKNLGQIRHITKQTLQMGGLLHEDLPGQTINFVDVKALQLIIQRNLGMLPMGEEEDKEE